MLEYVEPVETLCANVVDFGILGIFCFESHFLSLIYSKFVDFKILNHFHVQHFLIWRFFAVRIVSAMDLV